MNLIPLLKVTDDVLASSSIAEDDAPPWAAGTTYAAKAKVIAAAPTGPVNGFTWPVPRLVYESTVAGNLGRPPRDNLLAADGTTGSWLIVGAPNLWKAFDWRTTDQVRAPGNITYSLLLPSLCTGLGLYNVRANSVTVAVRDPSGAEVWSKSRDLSDSDVVTDWFEFFNWQPDLQRSTVFAGIPGYPGWRLNVFLSGTQCRVGQIAVGRVIPLGDTLVDTEIGFEDRSTKERDAQGNVTLVARDYTDLVSYRFAIRSGDEGRVKREVARQAGIPAAWFASEDQGHRGTTVFGFNSGALRIPLKSAGRSIATLEVEDLT